MQTLPSLATKLGAYLDPAQVNQIRHAYFYAEQAHDGQMRRSGEPYVTHPLAVADILADMHMDHQSLMAAILHDVIEDTGISKEALAAQFGQPVAELVDGVSKLTQIEFASRAEAQAENFQKMTLAMAKDIRVIMVKLADRLHNMRTLGVLSPDKRRRIARETLEIYAPIANRLGMNDMRVEFQELGFAALHPMRARRIRAAVAATRGHHRELIDKIRVSFEQNLSAEGIAATVIGREKNIYSIYQKMRSKKKSFSEIMDVFGFRITVENVDNCYRALGIIHSVFKPVPREFSDYIAIPKSNGYQSLHTVLAGVNGVPIEVQIRTTEMDSFASSGIAAHYLYKANGGEQRSSQSRVREWIKGLLEMQQRAGNSLEFIENVKIDLFPEDVYVFTPTGEIIELPTGATPVDFAYAVHTQLGNSCVACKINRRLAPLSEPLQSGNSVDIVTAPGAQPNPAWLNFVVTAKARTSIRHFMKTQRHSESIALGIRLLNKTLSGFNTSFEFIAPETIAQFVAQSGAQSFDQVLEEIGMGNRVAYAVAKLLLPADQQHEDKVARNKQTPFMIDVADGLILSFAKCCHPIPGDPVIGHVSTGRGFVIHTATCKNIADIRMNPEKCMPVNWSPDLKGEFPVEMRVEVGSERGIIAMLATRITEMEGSIDKISIEEKDAGYNIIHLVIGVKNRVHLANIMRRVRTIKSVIKTVRVKN